MFKSSAPKDTMNPRSLKRHQRAEAMRKQALSPVRILLMVLALPVTTALIAVGVYLRTTDYERHEAVIHLVALAGCDATDALGVGPFREGGPGYHARNDPDGDGVACEAVGSSATQSQVTQKTASPKVRSVGTAKFLRP